MRLRASLLIVLSGLGCSGRGGQSSMPVSQPSVPAGVSEQALMLLMADRRYYDSFTVGSLRLENPELNASLATTLGRIGDERGLPALHTLLLDPKPEVRREAAFALGLLGGDDTFSHLLAAVGDTDVETAVWAVAALADLGVAPERLSKALEAMPERARWQRLAPFLHRFPPEQSVAIAQRGWGQAGRQEQIQAIYSLARNPQLPALADLRAALDDADPWVRGWAARALGQIGDRGDLPRLRILLEDAAAGPTIEVLRAARRLIQSGRAAPPEDWRRPLLALMNDARPGVRATAIESATVWLVDSELERQLQELATGNSRREQELALLALAEAGRPWALDQATRLVTSSEPWKRALAAEVARFARDHELLQFLRLDDSARVRGVAIGASLALESAGSPSEIAIAALADDDPGVRAVVMEWLVENPVAPADRISRAIVGSGSRLVTELRIFGVRALLARAKAEPLERGLVVENLESLVRVGEYPARREAATALVELERPSPSIGPAGSQRSTSTYMQIVMQTDRDHLVEIATRHGSLQIELTCALARMTCLNFLQLAQQGYFDGQVFHRVVPNFVVQAGDPRGDGWGGPGYTLRDELNRTRFERGVIGMASSGPDTAGSQFFVALSRQPHLDGRYTAFGRVVEGDAILDRISQGDRLEQVRVVR